ncbi:MAG: hypothetical protein AAFR58_03695 [Cyanobacteria bacterium J06627_28]
MRALKLKGKVDEAGKLIVDTDIDLSPGEVEVIVLRASQAEEANSLSTTLAAQDVDRLPMKASFEEFSAWMLEGLSSVPQNFDSEEARWQYLKGKHHL